MVRSLLTAAVFAFLAAVPARGGNHSGGYHEAETLDCSECHVMHPASSELVPDGDFGKLGEGLAGELLRRDVNDLCLSCHDGSVRAADVLGYNSGKFPGDVRQAGYLNRVGGVGHPWTGHTLDSLDPAPGSRPLWSAEMENGAGKGLNCINCHAPHGSEGGTPTYRNLRSDAGNNLPGQGLVTFNHGRPGVNNPARDVFVREARRYDEAFVDFNEPNSEDSAIGRFCAGCHTEFHGVPGLDDEIGGEKQAGALTRFLRHPSGGVDIGAVGGDWSSLQRFASLENRVKVMSSNGSWAQPGSDVTPTCISCHKGHGNGNAFGLILRSGTGPLTEDGDGGGGELEHLCGQCHAPPKP
jgi:hypothetical protein